MGSLGEFCGLVGVEFREVDLFRLVDIVIFLVEKCRLFLGVIGLDL